MAQEGLEPTTVRLEGGCSILLSYPAIEVSYTSKYLKKNKANLIQKGVSIHQRFFFHVLSHRDYTDCSKAPIYTTKTFVYLSI